jgi:hypothetical protein
VSPRSTAFDHHGHPPVEPFGTIEVVKFVSPRQIEILFDSFPGRFFGSFLLFEASSNESVVQTAISLVAGMLE